jgi:hypothetical protein
MSHLPLAMVLALMVGHASVALAQPDAARAPASAASQAYRSAFEGYRPFGEQPVAPWKQTNDTVREVGGWRAYAREAQGSASTPAPVASSAAPPASSPHAGHH